MPSWKKVIVSGSDATLNSLLVSGNGVISGSLALPAYSSVSSFPGTAAGFLAFDSSGNVITTAGVGGSPFPFTGSAQITGSLGITGSLFITGSTTTDLVRITQTGTGNAFVVEDSANPDTSSFTITNAGDVGIGIATDTQHKLIVKGTGISGIYGLGGTAGVQGTGNQYGVYGYVDGNLVTGVFGNNLYGIGTNAIGVSGQAINGVGVKGVGGVYGGQFSVDNQNGSPIGVYATVAGGENGGTGAYIAGKFDASGGEQNYAVQLIDGSQGAGKVLVSQTADGKANWSTQLSGSYGITGSLNITTALTASGLIYPTNDGTSNQFISTDGNGNLSFSNIEYTAISIKNVSGVTIQKGTPCYITASGTSGNIAGIWPADASNPLRMPAGVIAGETLIDGAEGIGLINGFINGVDTSAFTSGDSVYVAVGGGYTNVRPSGSGVLIQKLGNIEKSAINGSGVINGPGYYNDLPNIQSGYTWIGNNNGVAVTIATASLNVLSAQTASYVNTLNQNVLISGSLTVTGSTTTDLVRITQTGTGNAFLVEDSTNPDATPFLIDNVGNTMIGTTSSFGPLTVRGNGATGVTMDTDAAAGQENQSTRLFFKVSGSDRDISMRNLSGSLLIANRGTSGTSSGTQVMFISSSGQTVFGSSAPLILSGGLFQGVSPYMEVQTGVSTGAYNEAVVLRHNGMTGTFVTRSLGLLMKLSSENMPNEAPKMGGMILRSTDQFANAPSLHLVTANSERLTITRDGNIGIGTTTPTASLHVTNITTGNSFLVEDSTNPDNTPFVIDTNGNIGVGILNPIAKLHVYEPTILGTTSGSYSLLTTVQGNGSANEVYNNVYTYRDATGSDWLTTRIHDAISIDNTFNTPGVNTRTWYERDPYNAIHSWGNSSTTYMTINAGNVGIGTTTPNSKLDVNGDTIITGSLTVTNNFTVLGSSSIQYITSSQLNIGDNIISVNTINPAVRFGGIAVIDSGSSPQQSGSLLFDSQNNQWIFVHQSAAGAATTSSLLIMGPQTFNDIGNETSITANRLTKGTGGDLGEHIGDSNITDTGTLVSINSNTQVTGSLAVSGSLRVGGIIFGDGGTQLTGATSINGATTITGSLNVTNNITGSRLLINGSASINGGLTITSPLATYNTHTVNSFDFDIYQNTLNTGNVFRVNLWDGPGGTHIPVIDAGAYKLNTINPDTSGTSLTSIDWKNRKLFDSDNSPGGPNVVLDWNTTKTVKVSGSLLITGSATIIGDTTITGSLTVTDNLAGTGGSIDMNAMIQASLLYLSNNF